MHTYKYIRTYKYIHAYIRTYTHTYINTYIHTYIQTYIHTYIPTSDIWTVTEKVLVFNIAGTNVVRNRDKPFCG